MQPAESVSPHRSPSPVLSNPPTPAAPTHALLYRSVAGPEITVGDVIHIFQTSRRRNAVVGVTGLLLYTGLPLGPQEASDPAGATRDDVDEFVQWLEGPEDALRTLYDTIIRDPRHHRCTLLLEGTLGELTGHDERLFPTWTMRFGKVPALPVTVAGLQRAAAVVRQSRRGQASRDTA